MTDCKTCIKLEVINGLPVCYRCHRRLQGIKVLPGTVARNAGAMCRSCKTEMILDIVDGNVYASSGQCE